MEKAGGGGCCTSLASAKAAYDEKEEKVRMALNATEDMDEDSKIQVKKAYITFRSMEAAHSILGQYSVERNRGCCAKKVVDAEDTEEVKEIKGYEIIAATEPDQIIWTNLGYD